MQRANWSPIRIWLNMSPELPDITSQLRLSVSPRSSARRIGGWPMPIWISVSGLVEIFASEARSSSHSWAEQVLQWTCTMSGPSRPCAAN